MTYQFEIPQTAKDPLLITLESGNRLFLPGANGTGKSSLLQRFYGKYPQTAQRLTAHRQNWLASNASNLSPHQKKDMEQNIRGSDTQVESRWRDDYAQYRGGIALQALVDSQNERARGIMDAVDANNATLIEALKKKQAPIAAINELLHLSNLPIAISVRENDEVEASKAGSAPYSIAELSDGERNAVLIASNVLTAKPSTLILIDEPERHLHRSIISPLLTNLFAKRNDCTFIVSTHDVNLCLDQADASLLLIRGCTYQNKQASSWDADLVDPQTGVDESLMRDILGARKRALFVEGEETSLDKPLYALVFPDVSIIPKSSCRDVEHSVVGVRSSQHLHWVHAFGIVDGDARLPEEIESLREQGIYALRFYSAESIYYHPEMQAKVARRQAQILGGDSSARIATARAGAISAVSKHIPRLSARIAEKAVRAQVFNNLPTLKDVEGGSPVMLEIDTAKLVAEEEKRLQDAISNSNLEEIVSRYPLRETPALDTIVRALGFQSRTDYHNAVLKLLIDELEARNFVLSLFGNLESDLRNSN